MYSGNEIAAILNQLEVTHLVWLPDSLLGTWESAFEQNRALEMIRVCREGEAWPLAAGLHVGGARPVVAMQTTGLFESGDALRNILYDLKIPLFALVGARSWLNAESTDSARSFAPSLLDAWKLNHVWVTAAHEKPRLAEHYRRCRERCEPGAVVVAEGRR